MTFSFKGPATVAGLGRDRDKPNPCHAKRVRLLLGTESRNGPRESDITDVDIIRGSARDLPAIAAVTLLIALFGLCQGLGYPLLSIILERQGTDAALIGLSGAMTPLGIVVGAVAVPKVSRRFGSVRLVLASTLMLAALFALLGAVHGVGPWFPLRFLFGCAISGLYVTSEAWINGLAPAAERGRVLALFSTALASGFATGPTVLLATGTAGAAPFLAAVAIELCGTAVVLVAARRLPDLGAADQVPIRGFLRLAPFLLLVVGVVSAYDGAFLTLFPVYAADGGFGERDIAFAITIWGAGNVAFQWPIGLLADRWSRRATALLLCGLTVAGSAVLPFAMQTPLALWPLMFVWGPASYGVYTWALIELGTSFEGAALVAGNAAFAMVWGVGGLAGPAAVGAVMHRAGPRGLPLALGAIYAVLFVIAALRPPAASRLTAR